MLASSSNFFTANVIIDRITWECIIYYMESEEFIKIAKHILGEEKYNEYKMFVCPEDAIGQYGIGVIEGMACGLPIIATKVGGIPELVDSSNGILVNKDNIVDNLYMAMQEMLVKN